MMLADHSDEIPTTMATKASPKRVLSPLEGPVDRSCHRVDASSDRTLNPLGGGTAATSGVWVEVTGGSLFEALSAWLRKHYPCTSLTASKAASGDPEYDAAACEGESEVSLSLGFGSTTIEWEGRQLRVMHQGFGKPHWAGGRYHNMVISHEPLEPPLANGRLAPRTTPSEEGSDAGGELSVVLDGGGGGSSEGGASRHDEHAAIEASIRRLCKAALSAHETASKGAVTLYSFVAKNGYWQKERSMRKRGLSSVILPERATAAVFSDARRFLEPRAREWYAKHSIPYKRTYLLYGPPGCGKSSLINALASEFDCNVCMLSLADPDLKDDGLRQAMQRVPKRSVICLEDCDSVFNHHREKQEHTCSVTFSGLLNALDGIGDPRGTIFFLTTNHKDRLDRALIRPGRVDVQVPIEYATDEQISRTLTRFYEEARPEHGTAFVKAVRAAEGGRRVSMAQLQEHFVQHRLSTLDEALAEIKLGASSADDQTERQMWS